MRITYLPTGVVFSSKHMEVTEVEYNQIKELLEKLENMNYLSFPSNDRILYFPNSVLKNSMVSVELV